MDKVIDTIKALTPILVVILAVGGPLAVFIRYRETRPENLAKARNLNITGEINLSASVREEYDRLLRTVDLRMKEQEDRHRKEMQALEEKINETEKRHQRIVESKDTEIKELRSRVDVLENENEKMKAIMKSNDLTL